jgi:YD repeat-containing protein
MKTARLTYLIFFCCLVSPPGLAIVDMKNANFSTSWTDIIVPGSISELKVERTYNSRSLFKGIFGFGWCSDFETKLVTSPDGTIKVFECGAGLETTYTGKDHEHQNFENNINKIVNRLKITTNHSEDYLNNLKSDLKLDNRRIIRMMLDLGIAGDFSKGESYFNGTNFVVVMEDYYEENLGGGAIRRFNKAGQLIFDKKTWGSQLSFYYKSELLKLIQDHTGRRLVFNYNNNKTLNSIVSLPGGYSTLYEIQEDELIGVKNGWGNTYSYEYDNLFNLTKATWPDKSYIQLTYNQDKDWVTSYRDRQGCIENYDYQSSKDDPTNHYWSVATKTCNDKVVSKKSYEFLYKINRFGGIFLYKIITQEDDTSNEIVYHKVFDLPIYIRRDKREILFDYYPNGLLKTKAGKLLKYELEYDPQNNQISRIRRVQLDDKGNVQAENSTTFRWNARLFLESVETDDSYKSNIVYDAEGRILSVQDQDKMRVKIEYEDRFGKPSDISYSGSGSIHVRYNSDSDISEIVPVNEGRELALQIKSFLEKLLEAAMAIDAYSDVGQDTAPQVEINSSISPIIKPLNKLISMGSTNAPPTK